MCNEVEEKKVPALDIGLNLIRQEQKFFALPSIDRHTNYFIQDGTQVELVLLCEGNISVESYTHPIKFGNHFGNRIFFNPYMDKFNINPKFVFDSIRNFWILVNAGYVCFAENEIEHKSNHKLYGVKDA